MNKKIFPPLEMPYKYTFSDGSYIEIQKTKEGRYHIDLLDKTNEYAEIIFLS